MVFNSIAYLIFLPVTVILFWTLPFKFRAFLLLVASYVFYMSWNPIYGLLIFALTLANFLVGRAIENRPEHKRRLLWSGIVLNIATLSYFKYTYMLHDSTNQLLAAFGLQQLGAVPWHIILPLGISFFVFEFIHYLVDVYKGEKGVKSFVDFALFASFFPTQISGPIKRFQDFIPQVHKPQKLSSTDFNEGVELILFGLFKKVCLADTLAVVVNRCYVHPSALTGADFWLVCTAFAFQVYFDFSGYTDVARGSARLLGFRVPINFELPYLAASTAEFWRRWHISLSSWLRDYLYIPLGGSRGGPAMAMRNCLLTMAVAGLWHGAAPHYVIWGVYMGMLLVVHRIWRVTVERSQLLLTVTETKAFHYFAIALTFASYVTGLAIFRSPNMAVAGEVLGKMYGLSAQSASSVAWWMPSILTTKDNILFAILPLLLLGMWIGQVAVRNFKTTPGVVPTPAWMKPLYLASLVVALLVCSPDITPQYIYFQF